MTQPGGGTTGVAFAQQPVIEIQDAQGNRVTTGVDSTAVVDVALTTGPGTLAGAVSLAAVGGVAVFSGLSVNLPGAADVLTATATLGGLGKTRASTSFAIVLGPAFSSVWPFTAGTDTSYNLSSSSVELSGGVARLAPLSQTDSTAATFGSGTHVGTAWDNNNTHLRLDQGSPLNRSELDTSWAPQVAKLLAVWHYDGNWNDAVGTHHATPGGGTALTSTSKLGTQAANFTTPDTDAIFHGTLGNLGSQLADGFSYSVWIKSTAVDRGTLFTVMDVESPCCANYVSLQFNVNTYYTPQLGALNLRAISNNFQGNGDIQCGVSSNTGLTDGNWHHLGISLETASSTCRFVLDGIQLTTQYSSQINFNNYTNFVTPWYSAGWVFTGQMDEAAVWNAVVTPEEFRRIYERQAPRYSGVFTSRVMDALSISSLWTSLGWSSTLPFSKGLPDYAEGAIQNESASDYPSLFSGTLMAWIAGLWHLDETTPGTAPGGQDFRDDSGNGKHGTITGTLTQGVPGRLGSGVNILPSSTGHISIPSINLAGGTWTASGWFKTPIDAASCATGCTLFRGTTADHQIVIYNDSHVGTHRSSPDTAYETSFPVNSLAPGWHHIAARAFGGSTEFFVDGASVGSVAWASTSDISALGNINAATNQGFGSIDELAVWSRALDPAEILQLYRRGANRAKFQVRSCANNDCSDATWQGPDGTSGTYFSELNNTTVPNGTTGLIKKTLPSMTFLDFTSAPGANRYFQYRSILESDDGGTACDYGSGASWCSPELKAVSVAPNHLDTNTPTISNAVGISFYQLTSLVEELGGNGCAGGIRYALSRNGSTWYYWTGVAWGVADGTYATANPASTLGEAELSVFAAQLGTGTLFYKAFLKSDGSQPCELDGLTVGGN